MSQYASQYMSPAATLSVSSDMKGAAGKPSGSTGAAATTSSAPPPVPSYYGGGGLHKQTHSPLSFLDDVVDVSPPSLKQQQQQQPAAMAPGSTHTGGLGGGDGGEITPSVGRHHRQPMSHYPPSDSQSLYSVSGQTPHANYKSSPGGSGLNKSHGGGAGGAVGGGGYGGGGDRLDDGGHGAAPQQWQYGVGTHVKSSQSYGTDAYETPRSGPRMPPSDRLNPFGSSQKRGAGSPRDSAHRSGGGGSTSSPVGVNSGHSQMPVWMQKADARAAAGAGAGVGVANGGISGVGSVGHRHGASPLWARDANKPATHPLHHVKSNSPLWHGGSPRGSQPPHSHNHHHHHHSSISSSSPVGGGGGSGSGILPKIDTGRGVGRRAVPRDAPSPQGETRYIPGGASLAPGLPYKLVHARTGSGRVNRNHEDAMHNSPYAVGARAGGDAPVGKGGAGVSDALESLQAIRRRYGVGHNSGGNSTNSPGVGGGRLPAAAGPAAGAGSSPRRGIARTDWHSKYGNRR